jgi:cysteine desulfurase/selenocysteine lyase
MLDVEKIREDFPILKGGNLIYFDNACTTLKPRQVVDAVSRYYTEYPACALRSIHKMAVRATEEFEGAREKVAKFINAKRKEEVIWTKNATEAINLVSNSFRFEKGDKVVTTNLEHSSGLIPWLVQANRGRVNLDFVTANESGEFEISDFEEKIDEKTKLVSVIFSSNVTGTTSPLDKIVKIAHDRGAAVLADAAQAVPRFPVDVRKLDVDFLAFSAHKMCGPTGIGCLYGKKERLEDLSQFIVGGETIKDADMSSFVPEEIPTKFEAGIQDYAGAIGFGAAIDYLSEIGMGNIEQHERDLSKPLIEGLNGVPNLRLIGSPDWKKRNALAAFNIKGIEPHDVASLLDNDNIAVRSGMHCAYPFHKSLNEKKGSVRASLYFYNTPGEIEIFIDKLKTIAKTLG